MKNFDVVQHLTVVRFWNNIKAEDIEDAKHKTIHADTPPDNEKIINSEIDVDEV